MSPVIYNAALFGGLALLVGAELRSESFRRGAWGSTQPQRVRRNWSFLLAALLAGNGVQAAGLGLRGVLPAAVDWTGHVGLELLACFLAGELFGWGAHYIKHRHGWLWRFHFQHHRETHYDVWLVTHTHALEVIVSGTLMSAVLVVLGFSASVVQAYLLFYSLANTYQHSSFDLSLGWLDKLIVNPAYHRYHHAVGSAVNFGNTLTIWDVVFRTACFPSSVQAPDVQIGIEPGPEPFGFGAEMLWFLEPEGSSPEAAISQAKLDLS